MNKLTSNPLYKLLFAFTLTIAYSSAQAQIFPVLSVFDAQDGLLKLPNLVFEGKVYYLELSVDDPVALTLKIEADSLLDITPDGNTAGKTPADIVGTWNVDDEDTTVTFNADGTWRLSQAAGADTESCPDGGDETGTFRYTASTGIFVPVFLTDENGPCGLSDSEGVMRIFTDGNTMQLLFNTEVGATLTLE